MFAPGETMSHLSSTHSFTTSSEALSILVVGPPTLIKVSTGAGNFAIFDEVEQSVCGCATNTKHKNESLVFLMPLLKLYRSSHDDGDEYNKLFEEDDFDDNEPNKLFEADDSDDNEPLCDDYVTCSGAKFTHPGTSQCSPSVGETLMGIKNSLLKVASNLLWIR